MKILKILAASVLLSGCVSADCTENCYLFKSRNLDTEHKCDINPYLAGCPIKR